MLTFLLGPFFAVLPKRWRESLPMYKFVEWRIASILSGFGESAFAVVAMLYWYSYSMSTWVSRGLDAALAGEAGPGLNEQQIGFMAIFIFATHPLTWLIAYVGAEGPVRLLSAAFTENNLGTLPLFVLDKIFLKVTGHSGPGAAQAADELCVTKEGAEEFLEIRACRRKPDWTPPRTVHYRDTFYRLEALSNASGPRPFRYRLRRLPAGVMGRSVLIYSPEEEPLFTKN
jgi:hypothetical protein